MRIAFTFNLQRDRSELEAEYDSAETVAMIAAGLGELGHDVVCIDCSAPLGRVVAQLESCGADMVFNTAEGARGRGREALIPAILEHLGIPFTGSDAHTCVTTLDKQLTKSLVAAAGVPVAPGLVAHQVSDLQGWHHFPAFCKPNGEGSSKGVTRASVARTADELRRRVGELSRRFPAGVLVEPYLDGLDVVVPYLEGTSPDTGGVLEPASYEYRQAGDHFYEFDMKVDGFTGLDIHMPARIDADVRRRLIDASRTALETLEVRDLARIDYRVTSSGSVYLLEVNALPSLESGASIYMGAARAGLSSVAAVLGAVLSSSARRYGIGEQATWAPRFENVHAT